MSLGSFALKLHQKYGFGLRTAYYRDSIRAKILQTRPIAATTDTTCEIHVLTSAADWLNLIWVLKSFYHYTQRHYALCIHADPTLTTEHQATLRRHFPQGRLINCPTADQQMLAQLKAYPRCLEFRQTNHLAPKVFDFISYLESDRMLLLDSDILFFKKPVVLLQRIDDPAYHYNTVNADIASAYTVESATVQEQLGFNLQARFNSGLGLIHKASIRLDWLEAFLNLPGIMGHFWRIEQTLFALCSSRFGVELLPPEYNVRLDKGLNGCPSRHYVGAIRHLMYSEGIRQLVKKGFLDALT